MRLLRNVRQRTSASDRATETPSTRRLPSASDTNGHQDGAIDQAAGLAHTFVAGVEKNIGRFVKRSFPPGDKAGIELLRGSTDLGR
jgi:hypothetical protein